MLNKNKNRKFRIWKIRGHVVNIDSVQMARQEKHTILIEELRSSQKKQLERKENNNIEIVFEYLICICCHWIANARADHC